MGNSIGAIGGMLGLSGGANGTGFDKAAQADIQDQGGVGLANAAGESYYKNQAALAQQQGLIDALQKQGGLQNQSNVFNQLQGVANGTGPNPAQAMLNQQTSANVANQAALMAGQRGAGANVGLMARQAAQQGAGIQQQAVGQGATMQANQSLNALGQMGGIANTQAGNLIGAQNAFTGANQAQQGNLLNALNAQNSARVSSQGSVNAANAGLAQKGMEGQQSLVGGLGNAVGSAIGLGAGLFASGGVVPPQKVQGPQSSLGQMLAGSPMKGGGMVDVMLSPGEKVIPPEKVGEAAGGKIEAKTVPGKAKVPGDSLKNDTYKTKLPAGSVVVKRTEAGNNRDAAAFVRKVLAKRGSEK